MRTLTSLSAVTQHSAMTGPVPAHLPHPGHPPMPDPSQFRKSRYLSRVAPAATITITEATTSHQAIDWKADRIGTTNGAVTGR